MEVFIDLDEYIRSGSGSIYEFAAGQLQAGLNLYNSLDDIRLALSDLERAGQVCWHVEN